MNRILIALLVAVLLGPAFALNASRPDDNRATAAAAVTIVDHITAVGGNSVTQPEALLARLRVQDAALAGLPDDEAEASDQQRPAMGSRPAGWRVQVFSDNNVRTAKAEAGSKQRTIAARFPQYQTYVRYTSPYWRLRVGDFRSQHEAEAAAAELRKAFPAYAKEIRVVPDRINLTAER